MPHTFRLPPAPRALASAAGLWFVTATLGQWAFVWFIVAFFTPPLISGDMAALNEKPHITGYVPGDLIGNLQLLLHVYLGAAVTLAGMLQLIPALRRRWPALHRWNGRLFLTAAAVATLSGFYLTLIRGSQLNLPSTVSISSNGVLILLFAALAWRSALRRDVAQHRRHALRAYLLVNGVWFLRIGMMLAGLGLSVFGYTLSYDSPVFVGVSFLSWIAPLAFLQLYLGAERGSRPRVQYAVAALFVLLSLLTAAGGLAAAVFMWWPRL
jgi:hypothetical protein